MRILEQGAAADLAAKNPDRAAAKFAALAYAQLLRGQTGPAIAAGGTALQHSKAVKIRFLAARMFVEAGDSRQSPPLVAALAAELQAEPQAYAKILEGEIALKDGDARQAIKLLTEANALLDTWIGHFDLGRAYLDAGAFPAGRLGVRPLHQAPRRGAGAVPGRGADVRLLPAGLLLPGPRPRGTEDAGFADSYRTYLDHPRPIEGRPAARRKSGAAPAAETHRGSEALR